MYEELFGDRNPRKFKTFSTIEKILTQNNVTISSMVTKIVTYH